MIVAAVPAGATSTSDTYRTSTLLPEKLVDRRPDRARAAPARSVRGQRLHREHSTSSAEFQTKASCARSAADGRQHRLVGTPRLEIGPERAPARSRAPTVDIDGQKIDWGPGTGKRACSPQGRRSPRRRWLIASTVTVRFRVTLAGSGKLALVPLGTPTEATYCPRPGRRRASSGSCLPVSQTVDKDGFRASWSISHPRPRLRPALG